MSDHYEVIPSIALCTVDLFSRSTSSQELHMSIRRNHPLDCSRPLFVFSTPHCGFMYLIHRPTGSVSI